MQINPVYLLISAALVILAFVLFIISRWLVNRTGIPEGRIIYSDPGVWQKNRKPLYDAGIGLTGKPDYLIRLDKHIIPAEVKSSYAPRSPYDSHILQLAAYCVLVEHTYGERPPYGLLRYRNRTFKIEFTQELEEEVLEMIGRIRLYKNKTEIPRSHTQKGRCARCGYRSFCDQRL
jgi:CRISPR-associated exonuclease Cas4